MEKIWAIKMNNFFISGISINNKLKDIRRYSDHGNQVYL